ncbi:MAG: choline dehydrogenase [Alphaproteobacteria bacterium]|jgi:choline dehydrogenase|nr:choline dehydrogenase [Alphaproteobacteria bacterium]
MSDNSYDYIVVGAGSAGSVLANRLSAEPKNRVLLLEAGPKNHPLTRIPISFGKLIDDPAANWCYESEPEEITGKRRIPVPRGRVLGGSSAINGLVFVRGQRLDYDTWAQLGNRGWSFDDVLPVFRRMENYEHGSDEWRAQGGPLHVSEATDESPLYDALFAAGAEVGLPRNPDYNGASQEGMCKTQTTIRKGRRMSAAYCYLDSVRSRPNLRIETGALAHRLLLEEGRCVGVAYEVGGRMHEARARAEVVVSGGAVNSPQLLELSGIGRPEVLQAHGIEVRHELAGVGESLRDHMAPRMIWRITAPRVTYNDRARGLGLAWQVLRYGLTGKGFLSLPSGPVLAFLRTREELETPDVQLHFVPFHVVYTPKRELGPEPGITIAIYVLRPESLGSIHIKSADPRQPPAINFNFLSNEYDRETLVGAVRATRRILEAPPMNSMRGPEIQPGPEVQSDDEILSWIAETADTAYHPTCTCRMGNDEMAVVDSELRVRGIEGLRVADGSIMPTLVSGNTNAACIMIGEKASDMILAANR